MGAERFSDVKKVEAFQASPVVPANDLKYLFPRPVEQFKESAVVVSNHTQLNISITEAPAPLKITVQGKKITLFFSEDPTIPNRPHNKIKITGARDVRLFSSTGIRFKERSQVNFEMDFSTKVMLSPSNGNLILNGDSLFLVDEVNLVVKVWTHEFGYEAIRSGYVYVCEVEPRPEFKL